jgi:putative ABC transport system permease protein
MSWLRFFRRAQWHAERRREIESYLEIETDENLARGMSAAEARAAAWRKIGNSTMVQEEIYAMNTITFLDSLRDDLRYAMRGMRRNPGFTAIVVLTLALGIGGTTAIFSVVNGVLLQPLPYPDPDRLIALRHATPNGSTGSSFLLHFTYQDQGKTFTTGLWINGSASITGLGEPEEVRAIPVTQQVLPILGVPPLLGRVFSVEDDVPGKPLTAVLSYSYWQRRFGGDRSAIGQHLTVGGRSHEIIGVMPEGFRFLDINADLFHPLQPDRGRAELTNFNANAVARLRPGVTIEQARVDVTRMIAIAVETAPLAGRTSREFLRKMGFREDVRLLKDDVVGNVGNTLWVLMGTVALILLIACANVANLLLVRAGGRQQELAVRAAIGAAWGRIARELLVESLALCLAGGLLGVVLAWSGLRVLVANAPGTLPRLGEVSINLEVLLFALGVSLLSGLVFGMIPVLKHAGPRLATALRAGGRSMSAGRERHRARGALLITQVAIALVLLVGSGLMIRTYQALVRVDPGFARPDQVQVFRIAIPVAQVADAELAARMLNEIVDRIGAVQGVESVAFSSAPPMGAGIITSGTWTDAAVADPNVPPPQRRTKFVSPGFLRTLGVPLLAGRDLDWKDFYGRRPVALVSEKTAREEWGSPAAAMGGHVRANLQDPWREIVGVVGDLRDDGLGQPVTAAVYYPALMDGFWTQTPFVWRAQTLLVRSPRAGTERFVRELHEAVWAVNPKLPLSVVQTLGDLYDASLARTSFTLVLLVIAGATALLLGVIGIYGVMSYSVSQRRREIGIQIALGAQQGQLRWMFVRNALALAGVGIAIGLGAAAVLTRLMASLLFEVDPIDLPTYAAVAVVLLCASALAGYVPARRAVRVDPIETLRAE